MPPGIEHRNWNNCMQSQSSTVKANKATTKVVKTLEEVEEIILGVLLLQTDTQTSPKKNPAIDVSPEILY